MPAGADQFPIHHHCDDLHVAGWMHPNSVSGIHAVVVKTAQRERVMSLFLRVKPSSAGRSTSVGAQVGDVGASSLSGIDV